jgi:hypothetical protein
MRASSGESDFGSRGYKFVQSTGDGDRIWANWWNSSGHKWITLVTMDGHYGSITNALPEDSGGADNGVTGSRLSAWTSREVKRVTNAMTL